MAERQETLVLVPTELERRRLGRLGEAAELVGFGPVAAAARAASLIAMMRPARVLLVGIAGTYDPERVAIGSAISFVAVAIDGIGAGAGAGLRRPTELGFAHWPGLDETLRLARPHHHDLPHDASVPHGLPLSSGERAGVSGPQVVAPGVEASAPRRPGTAELLLLTCCAAADGDAQVAERLARHPGASAEDMEGYAVALACALADVPAAIVRGISNRAGDRATAGWAIGDALAAARSLGEAVLAAKWEGPGR